MKIRKLIKKLKAIEKEHGNITVVNNTHEKALIWVNKWPNDPAVMVY